MTYDAKIRFVAECFVSFYGIDSGWLVNFIQIDRIIKLRILVHVSVNLSLPLRLGTYSCRSRFFEFLEKTLITELSLWHVVVHSKVTGSLCLTVNMWVAALSLVGFSLRSLLYGCHARYGASFSCMPCSGSLLSCILGRRDIRACGSLIRSSSLSSILFAVLEFSLPVSGGPLFQSLSSSREWRYRYTWVTFLAYRGMVLVISSAP